MTIFVTGRSGSGKSRLARELADKLGYSYVDVDKIGHRIYEDSTILDAVVEIFGEDILVDGSFNRRALGARLFSETDKSKIEKFNTITGDAIRDRVIPYLEGNSVIEWILLPHTKFWNVPAYRILVKCADDNMRYQKIMERDGVSLEYLENRENAGISYDESEYDYIAINDYNTETIPQEIEKIILDLNNR